MRTSRLLIAFALAAALRSVGGCGVIGQSPEANYIAGDRATFNAVAPEFSSYVNSDSRLTADQKARRQRTLATWRLRVETAIREQSTAAPPPATAPSVTAIP